MKNLSTIFFTILVILYSCKEDNQLMTGSIEGSVSIYNQFDVQFFNYDEITIKLAHEEKDTSTTSVDENGNFSFTNIETGQYTIFACKENYTSRSNTVYHLGGPTATETYCTLGEVITISPTIDSIINSGYNFNDYNFYGGIPETFPPVFRHLYFFIGEDENVSKDNYDIFTSLFSYDLLSENNDFYFSRSNYELDLYSLDTDSAYLVAYICNEYQIDYYWQVNNIHKQEVFYKLEMGPKSNTIKIKVP